MNTPLQDIMEQIAKSQQFRPYNSDHEAYAVILEEVDELWEEVKKKKADRDQQKLYQEAIQIAATAYAYALQLWKGPNE